MRAENRRVLLLLDNASSHRLDAPLFNVTLHMLPPNTPSYLQPQDAEILRRCKLKISKLQNRRVVERFTPAAVCTRRRQPNHAGRNRFAAPSGRAGSNALATRRLGNGNKIYRH
uniref:AlNc14C89G5615 protein n=1 Tax=Albugo laibachii Nc14 TaxID=890382 RepID=F0WG85_9STRA|nr:AlNc14C89G5615 [Albugo laibachii Nc14]|eukprot:CCA20220.1 AlNc14C89G5615 [Albugo laibachii Nc14]